MFTEYVEKAMEQAEYEQMEDGAWWGQVTELKFTWAIAPTLEECRQGLRNEVEDWLVFAISRHSPIPTLGGIYCAAMIPSRSKMRRRMARVEA
ncbi:MAG: type II toxin-antitoxin system HicB family antitoxin [Chloroflexota bacterium]|nr:type II toxin-antitoxin system HicB family antitoxin [Chloroflexota bacterium]